MIHNITLEDLIMIFSEAWISFWRACPSIGRLTLLMRCVFVFILISSVTSADLKPKTNTNRFFRSGVSWRTPTWATSSNRANRSSSSAIRYPGLSINSTGRIMTDIYGGIIDGVTDEVSKAMLDNVFASQDYHHIARTVVSGVLSQAARQTASMNDKLKSMTPTIPESLNETMGSKISKSFKSVMVQIQTLLKIKTHETTPEIPHENNNDVGEVKQKVKIFTAFVTRWVILPAVVHTLAYHVPEISIHELALWCKEQLGYKVSN
jgi:hypothetical protein